MENNRVATHYVLARRRSPRVAEYGNPGLRGATPLGLHRPTNVTADDLNQQSD